MDFVQRVRDSRTAQARRQAMKRVTYASVVQEESVPQLGFSFGGGSFLPKPKRSLRPEVRSYACIALQSVQPLQGNPCCACLCRIGCALKSENKRVDNTYVTMPLS